MYCTSPATAYAELAKERGTVHKVGEEWRRTHYKTCRLGC